MLFYSSLPRVLRLSWNNRQVVYLVGIISTCFSHLLASYTLTKTLLCLLLIAKVKQQFPLISVSFLFVFLSVLRSIIVSFPPFSPPSSFVSMFVDVV